MDLFIWALAPAAVATAMQVSGFWPYPCSCGNSKLIVLIVICRTVWTLSCNYGKKTVATATLCEQTLKARSHGALSIGFHCYKWSHSHEHLWQQLQQRCRKVPQVNRFQPHSVQQWLRQNILAPLRHRCRSRCRTVWTSLKSWRICILWIL